LRAQLPPQVDVDDLVDEAYEGLVDAIRRFNPQRDVRFETFASKRLFGAMRDYLRRIDPMPRLARTRSKQAQALIEHYQVRHGRAPEPDDLQKLLRHAALKRFRRKLQREPNPDELARLNKFADSSFRKTLREGRPAMTVSFNGAADRAGSPAPAERDATTDRRLLAGGTGSPLGRAELNDLRRWITQGFSRRDRLIIVLYYYEQMTMKEIGLSLGCSESRVSQRLVSILRSLRSRLQRTGGETEFYGK
jgi:RNA polymerase sigma factor for flagellar operon FliA